MSNKIKMFVDNWSYEDFNDFSQAVGKRNLAEQFRLVEKLVVAWDYDSPIEDGIMALSLHDSSEVVRTVMETIAAVSEDIDTSDVTVDFRSWNTQRFFDFMKAGQDNNIRKVERMMHEVASIEGVSPEARLDFQDGSKMMKAITDEYGRLISGKV